MSLTPSEKNLNGAGLEHFSSIIKDAIADKSEVSVSATGTATDEVGYITIDGVEKKIVGGGGSSLQNILDGSAIGSVRTSSSKAEDSSYTIGDYAFAEGVSTKASGGSSHAEGDTTTARGYGSHAEGINTTASVVCSHAEGAGTKASGNSSHAEGYGTTASGAYSHAEGYYTAALSDCQHVQGKYNNYDTNGVFAFIIGNGTSNNARSNALTVDWAGNLTCNNIPAPPSSDGEYNLHASIVNGVPTHTWEENKTPNASTSTVGGLTVRLNGNTLYIRNDGGEA